MQTLKKIRFSRIWVLLVQSSAIAAGLQEVYSGWKNWPYSINQYKPDPDLTEINFENRKVEL